MKPNFLIIGAQKSGTTSLFYYLKQHPEIYFYPGKEIHYFSLKHESEGRSDAITLAEYEDLFKPKPEHRAIGEASPSYIYSKSAAKRIFEYNPQMKIIAILRNPAERAYSNYVHNLRQGREKINSFEEAIQQERERIEQGWDFVYHYVNKGFYFEQLTRYYDLFDPSQIRVFLFDDLIKDPLSLIKEIFELLEVDKEFIPDTKEAHNVSGVPKYHVINSVINNLKKGSSFVSAAKKIVPANLRKLVFSKLYEKQLINTTTKNKLIAAYAEDIKKLETLINRDLSRWYAGQEYIK